MPMIEPQSPEWWRDRLLEQYVMEDYPVRRGYLDVYDAVHRLPVSSTSRYADSYADLMRAARTPWGRLIVDTTAERLHVQGFRVDDQVDVPLWESFVKTRMAQQQSSVHREALASGVGYVSVWEDAQGMPSIMQESTLTVSHENYPGSDTVAAAIKVWPDEIRGVWRADLYLPSSVHSYEATWVEHTDVPRGSVWKEAGVISHDRGRVPIIPFVTRKDWMGTGRSELADLLPLFDRFELVTADMIVASSYGAFRQRWATGLEIPIDPETGEEVEPFRLAVDRLWVSEDQDTRFGAFDATDVTPYIRAKDAIVAEIAAVSRIPAQYFVQSELANPPSAQALEAAEVNLISKVRERQSNYGDSWEEVASQSRQLFGDGNTVPLVETVWKDPRTRSESQTMDAALKLSQLGVPFEEVAQFIGYSPTEVERMRRARMAEALMQSVRGIAQPAAAAQAGSEDEDEPVAGTS